MNAWRTGTPDVAEGKKEIFWCAVRFANGTIHHQALAYLNAHIMPLSDFADGEIKGAVPVGEDGDYAWTGWHLLSCEYCETQWTFTDEVIAWMRLPTFPPVEGSSGITQPEDEHAQVLERVKRYRAALERIAGNESGANRETADGIAIAALFPPTYNTQ